MRLSPRLVAAIIQATWLVFLIYWVARAFGNKKTVYRQSQLPRLLFLAITAGFIGAITSIRRLHIVLSPTTIATELAGIAMCIAGVGIAIWARRVLGANWSGLVTLKQGHELVRRGPYAYVRHPIYSGILLAALGTFLCLMPTLQGVICMLFLFVGLRLKSLLEEQILSQHFPEQYPQYRSQVKALIPFVY